MNLTFTVHGKPVPQGSKVAHALYGRDRKPRTTADGRVIVVNRESNANLPAWRDQIARAAIEAMLGREPVTCGVCLDVAFTFARPKSHYGTGKNAGKVKPSAPTRHTQKPDRDKLLRAVQDALTGIVYRDDSQVDCGPVTKHWWSTDRATITIVTEETNHA